MRAMHEHAGVPCRYRQLIKPIVAARVPRAIIMGNHDDEADLMREQIVRLDIQLKVLT